MMSDSEKLDVLAALDDSLVTAEKLRVQLAHAADCAEESESLVESIECLYGSADDLCSRISNKRESLRSDR